MRIGNCTKTETGYDITQECVLCGGTTVISVTPQQLFDLRHDRGFIQNILHNISMEERETFLSGLCGKCWDRMYKLPDMGK